MTDMPEEMPSHSMTTHEALTVGINRALPEQLLTDPAYLLGRLGREVRRQFMQVLSKWEVNLSHYGVLQLLEAMGQVSQQFLAETLSIDRANMVAVLDGLEQRGLIQRQLDLRDRRRYAITLTEAGKMLLQQIREAREQGDAAFFAGLDSEEQETLYYLLTKLFQSLTAPATIRVSDSE